MMYMFEKLKSFLKREQNLYKLIKRGLVVGDRFTRMGGVIIDPSHCWHIKIGNNVSLAPNVHILAHDASTKKFLGYTKVGNVSIGDNVFIGAGSIVLLGVTVGDNVVVGAGSVVASDIPSNSVAAGSPARVICSLDDYLQKEKAQMNDGNVFGEQYTLRNAAFSDKERKTLRDAVNRYSRIYVE